jgi:ribose/xylose/arabinose/galactoside ABC-type transport system permease subunit
VADRPSTGDESRSPQEILLEKIRSSRLGQMLDEYWSDHVSPTLVRFVRSRLGRILRGILIQGGPIIALALLCLYFDQHSDFFWTPGNRINVLRRTSVTAIFAIGQTFVILTGGIDLSVGAIGALAASISAVTMTQRVDFFGFEFGPVDFSVGLLIALGVGVLAGLINGVLITKGRIPDFIATLGTMEAFRGIALIITDGLPVPSHLTATELRGYLPEQMISLGSDDLSFHFFQVPQAALAAIVMAVIALVVLRYTVLGRSTFAVGGNREAARVSGISIDRTKIAVYVICGLLAAVAGFLLAGRLNSANALMADDENLNSIAAVVIGGTNLFGGEGGVSGSVIGAVITNVLRNGLNLLDVSDFYQRIAKGSVIVLVVIFDQWRRRRFGA